MAFPDKIIIFSPNENISSQDANLLSSFLYQTHKTFIDNYVSEFSCRVAGLIPSFINNHTSSPLINLSTPGVAVFNLTSDPNSYSGGSFFLQSFSAIGITPPISSTRTDSIDIIYQELEGASGGVGSFDLRDEIDNAGNITPNQPFHTQKWTSCSVSYVTNSPSVNGGNPQPGSIRLCTFTVTSSGDCALTFTLPSIWENQTWPSVNSVPPNNANASNTLFDHLSAIRYQLNAIIGKVNWYDSPVLSLLQLGNAPQFWGGTATGAVNQLNLTIANFPINANIVTGTRISFFVNNTNTGSVNVSVNGQSNISLRDSKGNVLSGGELSSTGMYEFIYTGSTFNLLGDPVVDNDLVGTQVQNGSFESWTGNTPTTWTVSTTQFASIAKEFNSPGTNQGSAHGGNALRVDTGTGGIGGGGGSASVTSSLIPISDLANYYIKFKTYATSNTLPINVSVTLYDYQGIALSGPTVIWTASVSTPTSWKTFYGSLRAWSGTTIESGNNKVSPYALTPIVIPITQNSRYMSITVSAGANGGASNQSAWFDDVEIFTPVVGSERSIVTTSGSHSIYSGANTVQMLVTLVGAGGAGGNQPSGDSFNHGGGGGASGSILRIRVNVNPETLYFIQVGAGGTATSGNGNPGGTTQMLLEDNTTILVRAFGGGGGQHISGGAAANPAFDTPGFLGPTFGLSVDGTTIVMEAAGANGANLANTNPNQNGGNGGGIFSPFNPYFFGPPGAGAGGNNAGSPPASAGQWGGGGGGAATGPFNFFSANGGDGLFMVEF